MNFLRIMTQGSISRCCWRRGRGGGNTDFQREKERDQRIKSSMSMAAAVISGRCGKGKGKQREKPTDRESRRLADQSTQNSPRADSHSSLGPHSLPHPLSLLSQSHTDVIAQPLSSISLRNSPQLVPDNHSRNCIQPPALTS